MAYKVNYLPEEDLVVKEDGTPSNLFQSIFRNLVATVNKLMYYIYIKPVTVANLPTVGKQGRRAFVTDSLAPAFGAIVAGGGAVPIPVYDDGTNWRVG